MGVVVTSKLSALRRLLPFVEVAMQYLWIAYFIFLHGLYGQSIGKMITGVKLIDKSEEKPITYWQATLREIAPISASIIFYRLRAYCWRNQRYSRANANAARNFGRVFDAGTGCRLESRVVCHDVVEQKAARTIHDFIAGTIVVRSKLSDLQESFDSKQAKHRDA